MKRLLMILSCVVVLSVAMRPDAVRASIVVYQNTLGDNFHGPFPPGTLEVGDEVILAGVGSQTLTEFSFLYQATVPLNANATVTVAFYPNDGGLVSGHALPGSAFWTSPAFGIIDTEGAYTKVSYNTTDFGTLGTLVVPHQFTWSVKFAYDSGVSVVLADICPPTIGQNFSTYWQNDGSGWTLNQSSTIDPGTGLPMPVSFGATFTAVPEPSAIWVPTFSALIVIIARRISRRRRGPVTVLDAN